MRRAPVVLVLALAALFCLSPLAEVDFYWHLLAGQQILKEGHAPQVDTFTYTSAGRPWVDMHWLFQAGVALIERHGGWHALDLFKVAMVVSAFATSIAAAGRRRLLPAAVLALPAVVVAQERFTLRPEIASFAVFAGLLLLLSRRWERPALMALVPPLFLLWANLHALFAVGLAALGLVLVGDSFEAWRARDGRPIRPLALAAIIAVPATLVTPYGMSGWGLARTLFFERVASTNLYGRGIAEFQPPFGGFGRTASVAAFAILILMVVAAAAAGRRALRPADRLLLVAFLFLALLARRNMALFALVATAIVPAAAATAWSDWPERLMTRGAGGRRAAALLPRVAALGVAGLAFVLMADVASNRFFARDGTQRAFGLGVAPKFYPEALADAVLEGGLEGESLNDMTMGGYLAWRWFPRRRTYIDGRLEVQAPGLFETYVGLQQDPGRFEQEARARRIVAVLWSHQHALDAGPLLHHLATDPGWRLQAVDLSGALFVRPEAWHGGEPVALDAAGLARLGDGLLVEAGEAAAIARREDPLPAPLRSLLPRREIPAAETGAALFFALIGRPVLAEPLLRDAAARAPASPLLRHDLGMVLIALGRDAEARAAFEAALALDPGLADTRAALGDLAWRGGDAERALVSWAAAERAGGLPAASRRERATLYAGRGRIDEAIDDYRAAIAAEPSRAAWRADLASLYLRRGLAEPAVREIRRARALAPGDCRLALAEAGILEASGDVAGADRARREALQIDPACGAPAGGVNPSPPAAAPPPPR